jgi:hypothetical protein
VLLEVSSLGTFIVFGAGIGISSRRTTMVEYVQAINRKLSFLRTPTRVIDWHHATGNYVVQTPKNNRWAIADELSLALGVPCVVLLTQDVIASVSIANKASSPPDEAGIRWTKGIAFMVKGAPCTVDLKPTPRAVFFRINNYAVGVFKRDQLTENKELERESRSGGWGAISEDVSKAVGGTWTSRTLTRIEGTIEKALKHTHT